MEFYMNNYTGIDGAMGGKVISLGLVMHTINFILIMLYRKYLSSIKNGILLFNFAVLFLFAFRLALTIPVLGRINLYFGVFYIISIISLTAVFRKNFMPVYAMYILLLSIIMCVHTVRMDYRYIPYTNYLEYIFKPKPDREYRDEYNKKNSPYSSVIDTNEK
jgi:hypothetical protein